MTADLESRPTTRRRASRAAGPAGTAAPETATVRVKAPTGGAGKRKSAAGPPPRRPAHRKLVANAAGAFAAVLAAALIAAIVALGVQIRHAEARAEREQRFVDTATSLLISMFSYTQDNIDSGVDQWYANTSGPLRDQLSQPGNLDGLKSLFRDTNAKSEAIVNGAALEGIDPVSNNASVLVSMRVTVTDIDGINKPTQFYKLRVTVHEDDDGKMTLNDITYPEGGN
ncbi:mammalian cell entry protein [Mycobacterium sp. MYCO198283]|uniref:mammalian cell entry protein n=1 Tax=Mycobacterium sp. MYCO198283 TaxID=2883505 RepID=UPI001E4AAEAC|nr:mammalian cell entry protein [Mycobacterium sp. MYCO198283]MCG5431341.1 mammalian cell entry protein [Mycobacterium sp. MYCO198283]